MKFLSWETGRKLRQLFEETSPTPAEMAARLRAMERDIFLPVKAVLVGILIWSFFQSRWFEDAALARSVAHQVVVRFFLIYLLLNVGVAFLLIFSRRISSAWVERIIFTSSFLDGLLLATLTFVTGGFDSLVYWLFIGLIIRNALSSPLAIPQILLNLSAILCYVFAGLMDVAVPDEFLEVLGDQPDFGNPAEPFILRVIVLLLMAACCYGIQVLLEKHRQAEEEAREFTARQQQLRSAGRLAAQIAHQIKNPLGIINNAAFTLQRALEQGKNGSLEQLRIIREEVARSDRIITKLMGYAQLAEGQVEKLRLDDEIERAVHEVFPPAAQYKVQVVTRIAPHLPALFMQRGHLSEILVNVLQNAREAVFEGGNVSITAGLDSRDWITLQIHDDGPGIRPEHRERVFQAYFSTKEKGTGLGLAIVKHNLEMYGGAIKLETELGKGATFIINLPTRTFMKFQK